ncbi:MAG TPA: sialidase family protein [Candidatus Dormibacteraeota bacterium]|nr:sialidase family protein [Candidatus Dormibacteraeota bacterium]
MTRRLFAVLIGLTVAAALPLHAAAEDTLQTAIFEAKFMTSDGPNAAPDLIDSNDQPVSGDPDTVAAARAFRGRGHGVQVNDPALDNIQFFPNALPQPQRPYEFSIQSETSMAAFGRNVVIGFNNSADQPVFLTPQNTVAFRHRFLSAVGVSHDGGRTFTESSLPPIPGSPFTFGDPAVTVDRNGNFYYASLGADAAGKSLVFVGKSSDGGTTFAPGVTVALDPGSDKEWIAAGPDPLSPGRDNVYVTWTSFGTNNSVLKLGRSTDGGQTWSVSTIFTPPNTAALAPFIQFSNPVVDLSTGRLYVPFLAAGQADQDFFRVLASDDGGLTFHLLNFNVPGAPDPQAFPNITPGTLADCGTSGGFRLVLRSGPNLGGGRLGLPRFRNATRLVSQPSFAATHGRLFIGYNASNSAIFGDPNSTSDIRLLFSPNAGATWSNPVTIAGATATNPQHVHPAISVDPEGERVAVGFYTQLSNGQLRVDAVGGEISSEDGRVSLEDRRMRHLSPAFDLIPSMNPIPTAANPNNTTNYDRTIRPCYDIGEYMASTHSNGATLFTWGDNRNTWTSPPASPAAGTHTQPDVFAIRVGGND